MRKPQLILTFEEDYFACRNVEFDFVFELNSILIEVSSFCSQYGQSRRYERQFLKFEIPCTNKIYLYIEKNDEFPLRSQRTNLKIVQLFPQVSCSILFLFLKQKLFQLFLYLSYFLDTVPMNNNNE